MASHHGDDDDDDDVAPIQRASVTGVAAPVSLEVTDIITHVFFVRGILQVRNIACEKPRRCALRPRCSRAIPPVSPP